jgi:hypothetical protein
LIILKQMDPVLMQVHTDHVMDLAHLLSLLHRGFKLGLLLPVQVVVVVLQVVDLALLLLLPLVVLPMLVLQKEALNLL